MYWPHDLSTFSPILEARAPAIPDCIFPKPLRRHTDANFKGALLRTAHISMP